MLFYNKKIWDRCFCWHGKQWYKNIKEIPLYFKLMNHLIKYGYDELAKWDMVNWFPNIMKELLIHYRDNKSGYPLVSENVIKQELYEKQYDIDLDKMIQLIDVITYDIFEDKDWFDYEQEERDRLIKRREDAKTNFFMLFAKYFDTFWD